MECLRPSFEWTTLTMKMVLVFDEESRMSRMSMTFCLLCLPQYVWEGQNDDYQERCPPPLRHPSQCPQCQARPNLSSQRSISALASSSSQTRQARPTPAHRVSGQSLKNSTPLPILPKLPKADHSMGIGHWARLVSFHSLTKSSFCPSFPPNTPKVLTFEDSRTQHGHNVFVAAPS